MYEGKLVTHKWRPNWGIGLVEGPSYVKRFMDAEDHEMVAHGMGEYAGRYGSAVNVVFPKAGKSVKGVATSNIKRSLLCISDNVSPAGRTHVSRFCVTLHRLGGSTDLPVNKKPLE